MFLLTIWGEWGIMKKNPDRDRIRKESTMNFYQSLFMFFLLGFGIRLLYIRLNKGWLITLGMAVITAIAWLWFTDKYSYGNEGEAMYGLICTMLLEFLLTGMVISLLSQVCFAAGFPVLSSPRRDSDQGGKVRPSPGPVRYRQSDLPRSPVRSSSGPARREFLPH